MNKKILSLAVVMLLALGVLTACGGSSAEPPASGPASASEEAGTEAADVNPYAWLGLQDMPQCDYLDIYSTYHFIRVYEAHTMGATMEQTEAVDGINSYKGDEYNRVYSVDGRIVSLNENSKIYMETEMDTDLPASNMEEAKKTGTNLFARAFVGTGKGTIPETDDESEYEYYEYNYPETKEATGTSITERYYMKDGDVYAIYTKTENDQSEVGYTEIIKSISADIPEGTFDIPDVSGYEKIE